MEKRRLQKSHARQYLLNPLSGQGAYVFTEARLVNRRDLGHDHHALLLQIPLTRIQQDIAGLGCAVQIRGQCAHDHGADAGAVEHVVLHDDMGMRGARDGAA